MDVEILPAFQDNYLFAVRSVSGESCFVVDPGDAEIILSFLKFTGLTLEAILVTHHHADHIGGIAPLLAATPCRRVVGPEYDLKRIPLLTETVVDGDVLSVGGFSGRVMFTPGHTTGHICYHFWDEAVLFCGDTLFSAGCGRMFEGDQHQMWQSMKKIRSLPDETKIYCAHEYTLANIRFARSIDQQNAQLEVYQRDCARLRQIGQPTVPSTLSSQKQLNPFLRCDDPILKSAVGMSGRESAEVFGAIRSAKDRF